MDSCWKWFEDVFSYPSIEHGDFPLTSEFTRRCPYMFPQFFVGNFFSSPTLKMLLSKCSNPQEGRLGPKHGNLVSNCFLSAMITFGYPYSNLNQGYSGCMSGYQIINCWTEEKKHHLLYQRLDATGSHRIHFRLNQLVPVWFSVLSGIEDPDWRCISYWKWGYASQRHVTLLPKGLRVNDVNGKGAKVFIQMIQMANPWYGTVSENWCWGTRNPHWHLRVFESAISVVV